MNNEKKNPKNKKHHIDVDVSHDKSEFINQLHNVNIPVEVKSEIKSQLSDVEEDNTDFMFLFYEDPWVVTARHVPPVAIDGPGPVLVRGAASNSIIAYFSKDFVWDALTRCGADDDDVQDERHTRMWIGELEKMAEMVRLEMATNMPKSWVDELEEDL